MSASMHRCLLLNEISVQIVGAQLLRPVGRLTSCFSCLTESKYAVSCHRLGIVCLLVGTETNGNDNEEQPILALTEIRDWNGTTDACPYISKGQQRSEVHIIPSPKETNITY